MRGQASHLSRAKQSAWYAALAGLIVGLLMLVGPSPGLASNGRSAPASVDPAYSARSVSCPSAMFCVVERSRCEVETDGPGVRAARRRHQRVGVPLYRGFARALPRPPIVCATRRKESS